MANLAAALEQADVCEHFGTLFSAGYLDGKLWCEWSPDRGLTAAAFTDQVTTRYSICDVSEAVKPTLLSYNSRTLACWFARADKVVCYYSQDSGESWQPGPPS